MVYSVAIVFATIIGAQAQTINTNDSKVSFEVSNMKWKTVEGSFSGLKGVIKFNVNDLSPSNFRVCIDANSIDTDNEKRDEHLKTEDFFNVSKYPTICFESSAIVKTDSGYKAKGRLTMHGITMDEEIDFTYANKTFTGKMEVDRSAFKVGEDTGEFMVGYEVMLTIVCVVNN